MRSTLLPLLLLSTMAACGSNSEGSDSVSAEPIVRDSAGIAITEYSEAAWNAAPRWELSSEPLATIGDDASDSDINLTTSQLGILFADGTLLAVSTAPPSIARFKPDGTSDGQIGRSGEGPGEYQLVSTISQLGGDSIAVYDFLKRIALLFDRDGTSLDRIQLPLNGTQIPPVLNGRLDDGTWILQIVNPLQQKPEGSDDIYRVDGPILSWHEGQNSYDTLFTIPGQTSSWGKIDMGGQSVELGRPIAYGANPYIGIGHQTIWSTHGDEFVIEGRSSDGTLTRETKVNLPKRRVTEADREHYKQVLKEQYEKLRSQLPPGLYESEVAKIDQTVFATEHPSIGYMVVDPLGRIWVTTGVPIIDSLPEWAVLSAEGKLMGRVQLPSGFMLAASDDRVAIRREDPETGLVFIEVRGLNTAQELEGN